VLNGALTRPARGRGLDPFEPVLERLQRDSTAIPDPCARLQPWRQFSGPYSRVLQLRVAAPSPHQDLFVKLFVPVKDTPDEIARQKRYFDSERTRAIQANAALANRPGLRAPRIVAAFDDLLAIVSERETGVRLDRLFKRLVLRRSAAALRHTEAALTRVGQWVRGFQDGVPVRNPAYQRDDREYLDVRLRNLTETPGGAFTGAHRQMLLETYDAWAARVTPEDLRLVPIHADLCPSNVLVRDDGITVLDFAMSCDGNQLMDLAQLDLHLRSMCSRWRVADAVTQRLERALLSGFEPNLRSDLPLFRLMLLRHAVCHLMMCAAPRRGPMRLLHERRVRRRVAWTLHEARAA
jgi:Phosphotransferase enzyme family